MANNDQYEWFKGPQHQRDKGSNLKANIKVTWKFTRIFLLFSLFFFSMWGCVQTFTNKTSTMVGQGVEITDSQQNISPQVNTITTTSTKATYTYDFDGANKNDWLNKFHDNKNYDRMRKSYNDKIKNYTLDEALRGGNFIAKLNDKYIEQKDGNISVATTVFSKNNFDKKHGTALVSDTIKDYLKNFSYIKGYSSHLTWLQIVDPDGLVKSAPLDQLYFDNQIGKVIKKINKPTDPRFISLGNKNNIDKWFKYDAKDTTALEATRPSDADKVVSSIDKAKDDLSSKIKIETYNQVYNLNIMNGILKDYEAKMGKLPTKLVDQIQPFTSNKYGPDHKTINPDFEKWELKLTSLRVFEAKTLNAIFGLAPGVRTFEWDKSLDKQLGDLRNQILYGTSANYVPIATWGQAWEFGRGSGPFYGIFVYPIAYTTNKLINAFPIMSGWESFLAITFVVIIISLITLALSFKGTLQQQRMTELNSKKAIIEAKYEGYKGNKQMENRKRQEVSELYKKEGINPLSSLGTIFITMPFFLAMWRTIGTNQHLKATIWLGINFSLKSYKELFAGQWVYLPLIVIAGVTNILSQLYPRWLTRRRDNNRINVHQKAAMKKGNKTQNIMMFAFTFITLIFAAGLQVYFIIRSVWKVGESTITHRILVHQKRRRIELRK